MNENPVQNRSWLARNTWAILAAFGLLFTGWGVHQMVFIPLFNPNHWAWLTPDLEVIDYIKFWFRIHGTWTTANGIFVAYIASTAFKNRARWAWWSLAYVPIHMILLTALFPWLFFITIPLLLLAFYALWASREGLQTGSGERRTYGWLLFVVIGLGLLAFAYDNLFVIPALDVRDPDRGWDWLTTDPEIIDYIKFYFRVFGVPVLAFGMLTILVAVTGLRQGAREAWVGLWIVPVLVGVHIFIMPWIAPVILGAILVAGLGLWLSKPDTFRPDAMVK